MTSMPEKPEDICPTPGELPPQTTEPHAAPIWLSSVYRCESPDQALAMLGGEESGYVYQRDRHPNADMLVQKCCQLHRAERAAITSCGMSALSLALLSQAQSGDHVVVSSQLYGRSIDLLVTEAQRLGIASTIVDMSDLEAVREALTAQTRLIVAETITNPLLRVADIGALAKIAHQGGAILLVDNTFASPILCRPLELGADLVVESISKIMNGHSDVMLGLLCGGEKHWQRVERASSIWGLASGPLECWLAMRGLSTLALRAQRASENGIAVAQWLSEQSQVACVRYPGLADHPDHDLAHRQFGDCYGSIVTFDLAGGAGAANQLIGAASQIPFCPSLGEVSTTLSHPASTSHRGLSTAEQNALGINGGTIRLSVGTETASHVIGALTEGFSALT